MKYLKLFDSSDPYNINNVNIGKYVVFNSVAPLNLWSRWYGIIADVKETASEGHVYLIKLFNELDHKMILFIERNNEIFGKQYDKDNYYVWSPEEAFKKYSSKEEFDKAVEKIEMEKTAKKFGL